MKRKFDLALLTVLSSLVVLPSAQSDAPPCTLRGASRQCGIGGLGAGLVLNIGTYAGTSPASAATLYGQHFVVRESGSYENSSLVFSAQGHAVYNVIGGTHVGRPQEDVSTSVSARANLFVGGHLLSGANRICGFYGGAHLIGDATLSLRQDLNHQNLRVGPETGLICAFNNGVAFMISPSIELYGSWAQNGGDHTSAGVAAGGVARVNLARYGHLQAAISRTMARFSDEDVNNRTQADVLGNFNINDDWSIVAYLTFNQFDSSSESGAQEHSTEIGTFILNRF